ncbi:MAG: amidohydrolase family protein [Oscillospiraceae bacterium]
MNHSKAFALKGHILYSETPQKIACVPNGYVVCENNAVTGVFEQLPERFAGMQVQDFTGKLIIPGLVDLHVHAPQYAFRGLGMDLELLEWLNQNTFPEEAKYADLAYAQKAYEMFTGALLKSATTRACIFATLHVPATLLLMDQLEKTGLSTMVGKVNMNRNSPPGLCEGAAAEVVQQTREWIQECQGRYRHTSPILTPRFIPSCTNELMQGLAGLQKETGLPVQSHLSENLSEIEWVKELCPGTSCYAEAYEKFSLLGGQGCPTIMAHCVHPQGRELELLKKNGVYVAHCPNSNTNLASGIAPMRTYLQEGMRAGLGTDVAGGFSLSVFRAMADAIQVSKLRWRLVDDTLAPLTVSEAFYLGTKGGGAFFGKVGSFEPGYEFDAVVLDDAVLPCPYELTPPQRLERAVYLLGEGNVAAKYAMGRQVL